MTDTRLVHHLGEIEALAYMAPIHEPRATMAPMPGGRPPTGRTPDHERSARSKAALLESGGRRLTVNLAAESVEAIEHIKRVEGFTTDREAIEHALQHTSDLARRRERLTRRK